MRPRLREVFAGTLRDVSASWRTLIATDLAFRIVSFAVATPIAALLLRWLLSRSSEGVVADADIARFFFTSIPGLVTLVGGATFIVALTALEVACLMVVASAAAHERPANAKGAISFALAKAGSIVRVSGIMVLRVLAAVVPFVLAIGAVYLLLLRGHDINYYLSARPPVFWLAVTLAGGIVSVLLWLAIRTITRWSLAFPLVLFENVPPGRAIADAVARSQGIRRMIGIALTAWAAAALAISALATFVIRAIAVNIAPRLAGSSVALVTFLAAVAIVWLILAVMTNAFNLSLVALIIVRIWKHAAHGKEDAAAIEAMGTHAARRLGGGPRLAIAAVVILFATGIALMAFFATRRNEHVVVLAHRGSSIAAPENTLASFRLAIEERADMIELDVQESSDGEVLVAHDSDLMKVARSPMKIWEHTAAELRSIDVGKNERVPKLAEVLEACKGKIDVMIELKSYGHSQKLEERVATLVDAAGMQNETAFMSLNHDMVRRMRHVRPHWRVGALAAKALGDASEVDADFLAVEASVATGRFVRRAHRAGQDVYVWTVNDPAAMLSALSRGVDGLITDKPAVAREVVDRRSRMSDAHRFLVAMMLRSGVTPAEVAADIDQRP
jgi:glycerophosphoryl diester phosphodiesterase